MTTAPGADSTERARENLARAEKAKAEAEAAKTSGKKPN